jgi:hypothetical protein
LASYDDVWIVLTGTCDRYNIDRYAQDAFLVAFGGALYKQNFS